MRKYATSRLRRAACRKWLPPIAMPSPSPPTAMTVSSGRATLTPVASGSARPWTPLNAERRDVAGQARRAADAGDDDRFPGLELQLGHRAVERRRARRSRRSRRTRRASGRSCSRRAGTGRADPEVRRSVAHADTSSSWVASAEAIGARRISASTSATVRSLPPDRLKTCVVRRAGRGTCAGTCRTAPCRRARRRGARPTLARNSSKSCFGNGIDHLRHEGGDLLAARVGLRHGLLDGALRRAPADDPDVRVLRAVAAVERGSGRGSARACGSASRSSSRG